MTGQRPFTPQPSPIEQLLIAAGTFENLPLDAPKEDVEIGFDQVRSLFFDVMMGSLGAHPYKLSWNTMTTHGDAELQALMDMTVGSPEYSDKLTRLKHLVKTAVDYLP